MQTLAALTHIGCGLDYTNAIQRYWSRASLSHAHRTSRMRHYVSHHCMPYLLHITLLHITLGYARSCPYCTSCRTIGHIPSDTHATMRSVGNGGHYGIRYISAGNTVDCATGGEVIDEAHVFDIPCFHRAIGKIQRAAHILTGQLLPYVEVTCRRTHHANAFAGDVVVALRDHDIQCLDHRVILIGI